MTDMTLVLYERLEAVRHGVRIGTDRLREARKAAGLSGEAVARHLQISERTYRRWEKAGEVPREYVPTLAALLNMVIDLDGGAAIRTPAAADSQIEDRLAGLERRQEEALSATQAVLRSLDALVDELRVERRGSGDQGD